MRADANRAVKPDPDPEWGGLSPQNLGSSTGVRLDGFFLCPFHSLVVLRTTAGAASGAARKETATRYATVDLMMVNAKTDWQR